MKILIVDDVGYMRHYHKRLVESRGHAAITAESTREALEILEMDPGIDVVLADLKMPHKDGVELYEEAIRIYRMSDSGRAAPPAFILMTALRPGVNTMPRDLERLERAECLGFTEILFKPVDHNRLFALLEQIEQAEPAPQDLDLEEPVRTLRQIIDLLGQRQTGGQDAAALLSKLTPEVIRLRELVDQD